MGFLAKANLILYESIASIADHGTQIPYLHVMIWSLCTPTTSRKLLGDTFPCSYSFHPPAREHTLLCEENHKWMGGSEQQHAPP